MFNASPLPPENHTIHDLMWKNTVKFEMLLNSLHLRRNCVESVTLS